MLSLWSVTSEIFAKKQKFFHRETPKTPGFAEKIFRRHSVVSAKFGG
jgi:hypothetical protein